MSVSEIYIENLAFVVMIKIVMAYSGDMTDITRSDMNYFLYFDPEMEWFWVSLKRWNTFILFLYLPFTYFIRWGKLNQTGMKRYMFSVHIMRIYFLA
jgi:hypothetical protein